MNSRSSSVEKLILSSLKASTKILCTSAKRKENEQRSGWHDMKEIVLLGVGTVVTYYMSKSLLNSAKNVTGVSKSQAKQIAKLLAMKLHRPEIMEMQFTDHELVLAQEVVGPQDTEGGFNDIGGLEDVKEQIMDTVIYPLQRPDLFHNVTDGLGAIPKGMLLYGSPGTGKTMVAAAIAKEAGATFLNVRMSTILSKWMGESEKYINAIFSLATKLQPTVIFMDEVDSFFSERSAAVSDGRYDCKTEFMSQWDGLITDRNSRVMVLGATNRPNCIDRAFDRRLSRKFEVPLPDATNRVKIFKVILKQREYDISEEDFQRIAQQCEGYSGSDIKEVCRVAVTLPNKEKLKNEQEAKKRFNKGEINKMVAEREFKKLPRKITIADINKGFEEISPGGVSKDYSKRAENTPESVMLPQNHLMMGMMYQQIMSHVNQRIEEVVERKAPAPLAPDQGSCESDQKLNATTN